MWHTDCTVWVVEWQPGVANVGPHETSSAVGSRHRRGRLPGPAVIPPAGAAHDESVITNAVFFGDSLTDAGTYGFTHGANEDACAQPGQDYCDADTLKEAGADRTYVFAAAEHITTHAHELLAERVQQQMGVRPKP